MSLNLSNLSTYYVPEGETRTVEVVGVRPEGTDEAEPFAFIDGSALYLLCRVTEADTDDPLLLKQFGADRLLLAGLHPGQLDPGQVVQVSRFEGGGYEVEIDPDAPDSAADAM